MTGIDGRERGTQRTPPPPPRPIEYRDVDAKGWSVSILAGVVLVVLGVWMLTNLFESVVILAWLVGMSLIVGGVLEIVALPGQRALGRAVWLAGGLLVLAGAVVLAWPDITLRALALIAGLVLVAVGVFRTVTAMANRDRPDWPLDLGVGGLGIALGAVVLAWPDATLVVLAVSIGIRAIGTGLIAIGTGWQMHRLAA